MPFRLADSEGDKDSNLSFGAGQSMWIVIAEMTSSCESSSRSGLRASGTRP